jgi:hypothetical protein
VYPSETPSTAKADCLYCTCEEIYAYKFKKTIDTNRTRGLEIKRIELNKILLPSEDFVYFWISMNVVSKYGINVESICSDVMKISMKDSSISSLKLGFILIGVLFFLYSIGLIIYG